MQIVTSWMEEGIELGIELGIAQGLEQAREQFLAQGARDLLMFQLSKRFGDLDSGLRQRIKDFSLEQIQDLSVALFDLSSLDDLVQWVSCHSQN